jgi:hypothetical protein
MPVSTLVRTIISPCSGHLLLRRVQVMAAEDRLHELPKICCISAARKCGVRALHRSKSRVPLYANLMYSESPSREVGRSSPISGQRNWPVVSKPCGNTMEPVHGDMSGPPIPYLHDTQSVPSRRTASVSPSLPSPAISSHHDSPFNLRSHRPSSSSPWSRHHCTT